MTNFQKHKFKREEHVYVNDKFSELIKDAVRFFHGTPVLSLPLEETFKGAGVYAIYCISKRGLYKAYGEKINRLSYDVPIYVGKAVLKNNTCVSDSFAAMTLNEQIDFWQHCFRTTLSMTSCDFVLRVVPIDNTRIRNQLFRTLIEMYKPIWNRIFNCSLTSFDIEKEWCSYHAIRFHVKTDRLKTSIIQSMVDEYFAAS